MILFSLLIFVIVRIILIGSVKPARIIFITPPLPPVSLLTPLVEREEVGQRPYPC